MGSDYINRLQIAVQELHKCGAVHRRSVAVHEKFRGQTAWRGRVEVFDLNGHPIAKRFYAWSHPTGQDDKQERFVTVLEIAPVKDAKTAVLASVVSDSKKVNL